MRMNAGVFSWEDVLSQRYQTNRPPPLPYRRNIDAPRAQPQSRLLARLSPELRLMVWESVLGNQRIHIIQRSQQRLGYVVCPSPLHGTRPSSPKQNHAPRTSEQFCDICHGSGIPQPAKEADLTRARNKVILLGLALTCRQIYHESISFLYTLPTFEFSNPWTLPYLHPTIPTEHWSSIRTVELRWSFPGHWLPSKDSVRAVYVSAGRAQWLETCASLARMSSLRSFVLVLDSAWFCEGVGKLVGFLEPLRAVRRECISTSTSRSIRYWDVGRVGTGGFGFEEGSSDEEFGSLSSSTSTSSSDCSSGISFRRVGLGSLDSWELRLQGQSYYPHELEKLGDDLRERGIDCWISAV